jgi:GT2 family glycosyltransferase/glycosyltransferase involved in cell wall biosynthesis
VLTYRYLGWRTVLLRALTFPLRLTPLRNRINAGGGAAEFDRREALRWYRPPDDVIALVRSIRATTPAEMVKIVVADDASAPEHVARLRAIEGIELIEGAENAGFAANANRALQAADPAHDVVLLNADIVAKRGWLAGLQKAAYERERVGIVGAKLLYPDGRIQHAGVHRNHDAPQWFDHRYRFKPADHGPANIEGPVLAVTGACMYVKRELIDAIGLLDERYPMAYEDVDWCLRAWAAGWSVEYAPTAELTHLESASRGMTVGDREVLSQERFWQCWGDFLEARDVRTADGRLRVVYITEATGVGGGHRDVFEHLNRLAARGHEVSLYSLDPPPDWFDLDVPVHSFEDYDALAEGLAAVDAIKVATWWHTAQHVFRASMAHGIPVYFVQDIETSYYADDQRGQDKVLDSYRAEFRYMTISSWNRERLAELGRRAELMAPGIDLATFRPLPGVARADDLVLAVGRTNPLKNFPLTMKAFAGLRAPKPRLKLFGVEPQVGEKHGVEYVLQPSDEDVNRLFNEATVFVQTSRHEGFALPPLEAMATGGAVVCTDAHGNRDFCRDGENCLMPEPRPGAVRDAIQRLLDDPDLRARLGAAGHETAQEYDWERRIDALEAHLGRVADEQRLAPVADARPGSDPH